MCACFNKNHVCMHCYSAHASRASRNVHPCADWYDFTFSTQEHGFCKRRNFILFKRAPSSRAFSSCALRTAAAHLRSGYGLLDLRLEVVESTRHTFAIIQLEIESAINCKQKVSIHQKSGRANDSPRKILSVLKQMRLKACGCVRLKTTQYSFGSQTHAQHATHALLSSSTFLLLLCCGRLVRLVIIRLTARAGARAVLARHTVHSNE